jgi:hypothetical protein
MDAARTAAMVDENKVPVPCRRIDDADGCSGVGGSAGRVYEFVQIVGAPGPSQKKKDRRLFSSPRGSPEAGHAQQIVTPCEGSRVVPRHRHISKIGRTNHVSPSGDIDQRAERRFPPT